MYKYAYVYVYIRMYLHTVIHMSIAYISDTYIQSYIYDIY